MVWGSHLAWEAPLSKLFLHLAYLWSWGYCSRFGSLTSSVTIGGKKSCVASVIASHVHVSNPLEASNPLKIKDLDSAIRFIFSPPLLSHIIYDKFSFMDH